MMSNYYPKFSSDCQPYICYDKSSTETSEPGEGWWNIEPDDEDIEENVDQCQDEETLLQGLPTTAAGREKTTHLLPKL